MNNRSNSSSYVYEYSAETLLEIQIGSKLYGYSQTVLFFVALVTNPISFYIYSKKTFEKSSSAIYLRALSIVDIFSIFAFFGFSLPYSIGFNPINEFDWACKFFTWGSFAFTSYSSWIEVLVGLDRCLNIKFPNRIRFLKNRKYQLAILAFVGLYNTCYHLPVFIFRERIDSSSSSSNSSANITSTPP